MHNIRELLPRNDYVGKKDRQDRISVLKVSQPKLRKYIDNIGYIWHTVIPETMKFTDKSKVRMHPCPINVTVDEQCFFLYFLSFDTIKKDRKIDAIEKDLTARQVFYSNDHVMWAWHRDFIVKLKHGHLIEED